MELWFNLTHGPMVIWLIIARQLMVGYWDQLRIGWLNGVKRQLMGNGGETIWAWLENGTGSTGESQFYLSKGQLGKNLKFTDFSGTHIDPTDADISCPAMLGKSIFLTNWIYHNIFHKILWIII